MSALGLPLNPKSAKQIEQEVKQYLSMSREEKVKLPVVVNDEKEEADA